MQKLPLLNLKEKLWSPSQINQLGLHPSNPRSPSHVNCGTPSAMEGLFSERESRTSYSEKHVLVVEGWVVGVGRGRMQSSLKSPKSLMLNPETHPNHVSVWGTWLQIRHHRLKQESGASSVIVTWVLRRYLSSFDRALGIKVCGNVGRDKGCKVGTAERLMKSATSHLWEFPPTTCQVGQSHQKSESH